MILPMRSLRARALAATIVAALPSCASFDLGLGCSSLAYGVDWTNAGKPDRAIECLDGYLVRHKDSDPPERVALAYSRRGWAHQVSGRMTQALADYQDWLRLAPEPVEAQLAIADAQLELRQYGEARTGYQEILNARPGAVPAAVGYALAMSGLGHFADALRVVNAALAADPSASTLLARARIQRAKGDLAAAMADLDVAVVRFADSPQAFLARGHAQIEQRQPEAALADFDAALKLVPDWVVAFAGRGAANVALDRVDAALPDLDRAIRTALAPLPMARLNRSRAHFARGHVDRAIADVDAALVADAGLPEAHVLRALYLDASGAPDEARAALARAGELAQDSRAIGNVAWVLATSTRATLRDGALAVTYMTRVCEAAGRYGCTQARELEILAAAYAEAGKFKDAAKRQRAAIATVKDRAPDSPELAAYRERLALYDSRQPYRDPSGPMSPYLPFVDPRP
jgi:tetratricopeptide (TPR) repeat protein